MIDDAMPPGKKPSENLAQFNIRMPNDLLAALDEEVEEQKRAHPGRTVTRSDLIREVLYAHVRQRAGQKSPKRTP